MRRFQFAIALLILCVASIDSSRAQDRSLEWDLLTVHARLDADGALHVTERHAMVFTGEWNGGERSFQLRSWQSLQLEAFGEVDPNTQSVMPWTEGELAQIGEYRLNDTVLRWRNRMPGDPPFDQEKKIYEIAYVLTGVLIPDNGRYRLEHDLAFPDRAGAIRVFDAALELDPVWDAGDMPTTWHEENLAPGYSVFANASLEHASGGVTPSAVARVAALPSTTSAPWLRYGLMLAVIAFVAIHVIALLRREQRNGRFEPLLPLEQIDEQWLEANVFNRPPEVVGAAWDLETSASEVSALLARLAQEGALKSEVRSTGSGWFKRDTMYMELLCERGRLADHERELIDALFIGGSRMTDSQKIRQHYAKSGFNPAAIIKQSVEAQLPVSFANKVAVPKWAKWLTASLIVAAIGTYFAAMFQAPDAITPIAVGGIVIFGCYVFGLVFASLYRTHVAELRSRLLRVLICIGVIYFVLAFVLLAGRVAIVPLGAVCLTLWVLGLSNSIFNMMRMREVGESLELRRLLVSARMYFEQELEKPEPRLKDAWFPYLLAFGLGPHVDKWFKSIASEAARSGARIGTGIGASSSSSSVGSGGSSSSSSWTGGGGAFGGAGASGAWSAAVGSIAAGVSKPSSSSSSSSGGGSSSSSGGGGGGGW